MEGSVYVLTNPAMPNMVKIGKTTRDVELRLADLYSTGVPLPFECEYAAKVKDVDKTEKAFHTAFEPSRVNPKREFFNINPEQAIAVLSLMAIEDVTPSVQDEAKKIDVEASASAEKFKKKRRPTINYFEMGLKEGDILKFGRNEEFCKVLNGRQVSYQGEPWFLSNLTNKLLDRTGPMDGSPYWYFNGKNLKDIYNETYSID
ncbi:Hypothetical protein P9515_00381 [Prochlorococcus marinus str. MIT 9515]|uniref:Bacteriophage T5 Orf172 DNA-binding domain-containing protein n=1 Tax=Prochlorococcus marinus (strain MIT 9515) TaxID=167542 RepID=A2BTY6_PROM5|nr:GIY-YIG nuclease family protein [Prochlorococcus marinus]ABM71247.1 Hypothetical protein P9515_00381 [Prochlorococcus marinus str. MIT 9515]